MKTVAVLSTGNELLNGTTPETNGDFICGRLFPLSVLVRSRLVVGDNCDDLVRMIRHALNTSDIIIMTGGLGPTDDDNAVAAIGRITGAAPRVDRESLGRMEAYFRDSGIPLNPGDRKMAEVPEGARVLRNDNGLAPGFIMTVGNAVLIAMPGVPREMELMMDRFVIPFLKDECGIPARSSAFFRVTCMKESDVNDAIRRMELPPGPVEWGITAKSGIITVTFAATDDSPVRFDGIVQSAKNLFGERFLDPSLERPEEQVVALLRERKLTVSCAESCTGGLVSKRITDIPGSSEIFAGAVVAYGNSVKEKLLGVSGDTLAEHGAVSGETAEQMASGVRRALGTDIGVAVTGIAGPGGGSEAKPVGTVWFGLADAEGVRSFMRRIGGDRERVRTYASLIAIELLRGHLQRSGGDGQAPGASGSRLV